MKQSGLSIIIPTYFSGSTIRETLLSILNQDRKGIDNLEIIVVDDNSTDGSSESAQQVLSEYKKKNNSVFSYKVIKKEIRTGQSDSYNSGIKIAKYKTIALIQADVLFSTNTSLILMFNQVTSSNLIATFPYILHPKVVWDKYNLWQKILFDRHLNKKESGNFTKCLVADKSTVIKVGGYDKNVTAGEDRDLYERLKGEGGIEITDVSVIHVHNLDPKYKLKDFLSKEAQNGEALGILLRRYKFNGGIPPKDNFLSNLIIFFRPLLVILGVIPLFGWSLLVLYSYLYARNTIKISSLSVTILKIIPSVIFGTFLSTIYMVKGFILNRSSWRYL